MVKLGLEEEQIWVRERWNRESLRSDKNYNNMMKQAQRAKVLPLTLWGALICAKSTAQYCIVPILDCQKGILIHEKSPKCTILAKGG